MLCIRDIAASLPPLPDPVLHQLLADRIQDTFACGLEAYTHILIVEPGGRGR